MVTLMRWGQLFLICGISFVTGCSGPGRPGAGLPRAPIGPPEPYVRIDNTDSNRIRLQIAVREFASPHRGRPSIWLAGVSHIGDLHYYQELQAHLDEQDLVLFEGVGPEQPDIPADSAKTEPKPAQPSSESHGSLQSAMAASLGLVFQLDAVDYQRDNFRNSDLSIAQLRELMAQNESGSGQSGATESFDDLVQMMNGDSWLDALVQLALRLLGTNPKFQALGRLALIDLLAQIQGDPSRLQGLPPDMKQLLEVLLKRRNDKVVSDLKTQLPTVPRHGSVAIFFGTGHMPDLELKIREQLGYRPVGDHWYTVFDVDLQSAKVTPSERQFVDGFVKWQLNLAGASGNR